MTLTLRSSAFPRMGAIPRDCTCEGADRAPPLDWSDEPAGTKSFALIVDDPDAPDPAAPTHTFVHWVVYDLPATSPGLPEGVPKTDKLGGGVFQGLCWGVDRFHRVGYQGPCPPPGAPHHYRFRLYAIHAHLRLPSRATKPDVLKAMAGHVVAQAELVGTYRR